jgi:hypothetical protein
MAEATLEHMPEGNRDNGTLRRDQVETTEGGAEPAVYTEDAACTLAWNDYQLARNYVENNMWLLEWQHADILYQSPTLDRYPRVENGRPVRISRFLVAKNTRTMARAVKKALFAEQTPFFLRPGKNTSEDMINAWTALLMKLLQRMNFQYFCGLLIDCQVLQGTGIGKAFWDEKTTVKKVRRRKTPPEQVEQPISGVEKIPTKESDDFETVPVTVTESWPRFEYRRLGTTLFDPKCCTPNHPELSGGYCIDVDYVTFTDLQQMRELECYENIPDEETLLTYFFNRPSQSAPGASQVADAMTLMGSAVTHAEGENKDTSVDPLQTPLMLIERTDERNVQTILYYDGKKLTIRDDEHDNSIIHFSANWWSIDNCLYGMGLGKIDGPDQRISQGVINECLKMIAYPFNAPLMIPRGDNAPTQNVINRFGGFWAYDLPPGMSDFRRAVGYLETPPVPPDAWKMLQFSQQSSEDLSGANSTMQQGNLGGPGSSAARTATGASRIAAKSDDTIFEPVEAVAEGVIVRLIYWLVEMVKLKMPLQEIRQILTDADAKLITNDVFDEEAFLSAEFEATVLAGQRLQTKDGIRQLIPMFMQIVQQPQLLEYLHQRGDTVDFAVMIDLLMQVSELMQQDNIIRPLTVQEKQNIQQTNPNAQRTQAALAVEQAKGKNKEAAINTQGQVDLANKAAEMAMARVSDGIPLEHAEGLVERSEDEGFLRGQV